ncbi:MAG TPA: ferritin-like domain-containing protein [Coriobacteriia bacterium]|jgi:bacterioferritin
MAVTTTTPPEVIDSLNVDLTKEHGAIIQYLLHIAQTRDSVLRSSISLVAREEMWHFEWLTEAIRDRGGVPTHDRQEGIVNTDGLVRNLEANVDAENDALAHYEKTLETIGDSDPALTTLIQRIMDDERYHRTSFTNMVERVGSAGEAAFHPQLEISPPDAGAAAPMIGLEYEGLLQYLMNKYASPDKDDAETYFELATNEMRHLLWVATCFAGLPPAPPPPVPDGVVQVRDADAAHARAEEYENQAARTISRVRDALAGEQISSELQRIDYQHGYHRFQLEHMEEAAKTKSG